MSKPIANIIDTHKFHEGYCSICGIVKFVILPIYDLNYDNPDNQKIVESSAKVSIRCKSCYEGGSEFWQCDTCGFWNCEFHDCPNCSSEKLDWTDYEGESN